MLKFVVGLLFTLVQSSLPVWEWQQDKIIRQSQRWLSHPSYYLITDKIEDFQYQDKKNPHHHSIAMLSTNLKDRRMGDYGKELGRRIERINGSGVHSGENYRCTPVSEPYYLPSSTLQDGIVSYTISKKTVGGNPIFTYFVVLPDAYDIFGLKRGFKIA